MTVKLQKSLMHDNSPPRSDEEEWIIWNTTFGIPATATIGRIELNAGARVAWMERPFEMLGPFSLDELETQGRIAFAACIVLSRQRWKEDQVELRRAAQEKRRAAQERLEGEQARFHHGRGRRRSLRDQIDERQHRELLNLPIEGKLKPAEIKAAFRRLAQKLHPDVGGSHEEFVRITDARNALLEPFS